jgi:hypothetical protein
MGTQIVKLEPLPLPVPNNPVPRLPAWITKFAEGLPTGLQLDPATGQYLDEHGDAATLRVLPTEEQRSAIVAYRDQTVTVLKQCPDDGVEFAKRTYGVVANLMAAKPAKAGGPETTKSRIWFYEEALKDVPWWATAAAIVKWARGQCDNEFTYRGEGRDTFDYTWAPESADLRKIALRETNEPHRRIAMINKILGAVQYQDRSAEMAGNRARCRAIGLAVDTEMAAFRRTMRTPRTA